MWKTHIRSPTASRWTWACVGTTSGLPFSTTAYSTTGTRRPETSWFRKTRCRGSAHRIPRRNCDRIPRIQWADPRQRVLRNQDVSGLRVPVVLYAVVENGRPEVVPTHAQVQRDAVGDLICVFHIKTQFRGVPAAICEYVEALTAEWQA